MTCGEGGWRWAVGGWRLAVGGWRLAVGGGQWAVGVWRLAVGVIVLVLESRASLYKAGRPRRRRRAAIGGEPLFDVASSIGWQQAAPGNYPARYFAQRGGLMGIDSDAAYRTAARRDVPGSRLLPAHRARIL
jgi:hypothetical protein